MTTDTIVRKDVHTERIFVTAEMARKFLRLNIENNRPINADRVNQYARDMKSGRWKENGDTIKFSDTTELIDGQHRLSACVQAGIGFWSLIAYGVKRDAFLTIDRNQTRSTGQLLHLASGVNDYNAISGVLSWLWRFRDGIVLTQRQPTAVEANELFEAHPRVRESITYTRRLLSKFKAGPVSAVAFCHYCFSKQDPALAELFFDGLGSGTSLRMIDPVYQLRERIIAQATAGRRIATHELIALYFKAWIAEREQRTIKNLRWVSTEAFPNIGPIDEKKMAEPTKVEKKAKRAAAAAAV